MSESEKDLPQGIKLTPYDAAFQSDPHSVLKELRQRAPVMYDAEFNRWYLTDFEGVRQILRDQDMSVDPRKADPNTYMGRFFTRLTGDGSTESAQNTVSMIQMDDPDHQRLRGLINKAFTLKAVEALRPRIETIAQELLDAIDGPEFDLIASFSAPLSVTVICEMLGVDAADRVAFKNWSDIVVPAFWNPLRTPEVAAEAAAAQQKLNQYYIDMIAARRREPRDDLITRMVNAEEAGSRMTDEELIVQCNLLLLAGNVTTTDLIGNGIKALFDHDQMAKLRERPELIGNAIEEMLRFDPPVMGAVRRTPHDLDLRGCPVKAGDSITVSITAANRDPAANPDPERFDIERANIRHQAFGGGRHMCLGAFLARTEAEIGISALLRHFPNLAPASRGFHYRTTNGFRGLAEYWLRT